MNRLLQGDVGAGKTIVAMLAAIVAMENRFQVAFMAPTEILADQHYLTIRRLLDASRFRIASLTGSVTAARRREVLAELASGATNLVVGTHALAEAAVTFKELGLVIIDEQHRFGVLQRATLRSKGVNPDVLVMTATPIPRTLALTAYGDLDVSVMRDLPPGRQPIRTISRSESTRDEVYRLARAELERGRQVYVIYPLVDESEKVDLRAATAMADHLRAEVFPEYRVAPAARPAETGREGSRDGRVRARRRARPRRDDRCRGRRGRAERDVMIVEHAERFGLSQLHQLARPGRTWRARVDVRPALPDARARTRAGASTRSSRRRTASSSPNATWRSAGPATFSARVSPACRRSAWAISSAITRSWRRRAAKPWPGSTPAARSR